MDRIHNGLKLNSWEEFNNFKDIYMKEHKTSKLTFADTHFYKKEPYATRYEGVYKYRSIKCNKYGKPSSEKSKKTDCRFHIRGNHDPISNVIEITSNCLHHNHLLEGETDVVQVSPTQYLQVIVDEPADAVVKIPEKVEENNTDVKDNGNMTESKFEKKKQKEKKDEEVKEQEALSIADDEGNEEEKKDEEVRKREVLSTADDKDKEEEEKDEEVKKREALSRADDKDKEEEENDTEVKEREALPTASDKDKEEDEKDEEVRKREVLSTADDEGKEEEKKDEGVRKREALSTADDKDKEEEENDTEVKEREALPTADDKDKGKDEKDEGVREREALLTASDKDKEEDEKDKGVREHEELKSAVKELEEPANKSHKEIGAGKKDTGRIEAALSKVTGDSVSEKPTRKRGRPKKADGQKSSTGKAVSASKKACEKPAKLAKKRKIVAPERYKG